MTPEREPKAKQWTAGPWEIEHDEGIKGADGLFVAIICAPLENVDSPRRDANARLIASSPALYDALESLTNEASGFLSMADPANHGNTNIAVLRERIEQARAALRLARGEE